jgi:hypothetical protein
LADEENHVLKAEQDAQDSLQGACMMFSVHLIIDLLTLFHFDGACSSIPGRDCSETSGFTQVNP